MNVRQKEIQIGCGVIIEVPDTKWRVTAEVIDLKEDAQIVKVKGEDFEGWMILDHIRDVIPPGAFAFDNAVNTLTPDIEEE